MNAVTPSSMIPPTTPTTHTPPGGGDQPSPRRNRRGNLRMPTNAAPHDYRHARVAIDRLRQQLDEAETLMQRELPVAHLDTLTEAIDAAVRDLREPVRNVAQWARARRYPVRREADSVELRSTPGGNG